MSEWTIVKHRSCGTEIFEIPGRLSTGRTIEASEWHPLRDEWRQPIAGELMTCPSCGQPFVADDKDLERRHVER